MSADFSEVTGTKVASDIATKPDSVESVEEISTKFDVLGLVEIGALDDAKGLIIVGEAAHIPICS